MAIAFLSTIHIDADIIFISSKSQTASKVWVADNGNGTYKNPVLNADYSDPDAIRVGDDFYLVSSSFEDIPGLPILHSKDLVNWTIIGHALMRQPPYDHFYIPRHGDGVWAPPFVIITASFIFIILIRILGFMLLNQRSQKAHGVEPVLVAGAKD